MQPALGMHLHRVSVSLPIEEEKGDERERERERNRALAGATRDRYNIDSPRLTRLPVATETRPGGNCHREPAETKSEKLSKRLKRARDSR